MGDETSAQADVIDLLRGIPFDAWAELTNPANGWSWHTNIGHLTSHAADEIESLRDERDKEKAKVRELLRLADDGQANYEKLAERNRVLVELVGRYDSNFRICPFCMHEPTDRAIDHRHTPDCPAAKALHTTAEGGK